MKKLLTDAYQKASQKNEVGTLAHEAWDTLQTMFRLIKASISGEYTGVPGTTVAAAVAVLIYFLSPIDLIPDFIPVLGLLDDVALVAWFSTTLKHEMDRFHEWELTRPVVAVNANKAAAENAAASMGGLTPINYDEDRAQPARESAKNAGTSNNPTTDSRSGSPASNAHSSSPQPAAESAKQHGTHPESATNSSSQQSNTDSGLGSPESSSAAPVHTQGDDVQPTADTSGATVRTWEGSRNESDAGRLDTGGNVR
ncbi:DUF1232 domain-containing protein [Microvirga sp. SRT04]|uniref:DUF1232 domain-containing protein n=1 Tax=Hymenobacter properus TaxID=2791026 RepID=A0A931BF51_9BACT|nr:DUF1232 domain-containing protein [Hymenobacter properus]MBR7721568.1 DUF1232 domain-containing protein [Microvirga sp. SRT04]